ncbi:SRPBCC domain-containing protein [Luteococcus peritonei]|uniref:SRPBCC domain-containing protein n=1 Tax=Luteococcus peritonei TaxID=88874 RepID=A0ABW4RU87_9ACTN
MAHDEELAQAVTQALTPARLHQGVLTLTVALPTGQADLWRWITEPELLQQWSPVVPDRPLTSRGPATSSEQPGAEAVDAEVGDVRAPWALEHRWGPEVLTWQLAPSGEGTQLNLVHELRDAQLAADMAGGWHVCLVVLERRLRGLETGRCVGQDAQEHGWSVVKERYRQLFEGDKA